MGDQAFINVLLANILSGEQDKYCRLCLRELINNEFVSFDDCVTVDSTYGKFERLIIILNEVLGEKICDKTMALNALCSECAQVAALSYSLKEKYRKSTKLLNNILDNVTETLDVVNDDTLKENQSLYVIPNEYESKVMLLTQNIDISNGTNMPNNVKKEFVCSECDIDFKTPSQLKDHYLAVHETLLCDKCFKTFDDQTELEDHFDTDHRFKCSECPQHRSTEQSLKDHQRKSHEHYICLECGRTFKGIEKLKVHEESHNKKECPKCGKKYHTKDFYLKHTELCLAGKLDPHPFRSVMEQPYICEKCGKGYSTAGGLRVHERFVHGNAKPHVCPWCSKAFTAPSYLKTHVIKHTKEKNFKCDLCNRGFVSKEALLYHTRRHTGEKPYSCKTCGERFVNASARAEHIKFKHVGPTWMCEICSRKFVTKFFLKKHISKHHDPTSKLYSRHGPANVPSEENKKMHIL